jgi:hypothetical protein
LKKVKRDRAMCPVFLLREVEGGVFFITEEGRFLSQRKGGFLSQREGGFFRRGREVFIAEGGFFHRGKEVNEGLTIEVY